LSLDINSPEVARQFKSVIHKWFKEWYYEEQGKSENTLEQTATVAATGSGATVSVYIGDSETAVSIKNPSGFSLTAGQMVVIERPKFKNDNSRTIKRLA